MPTLFEHQRQYMSTPQRTVNSELQITPKVTLCHHIQLNSSHTHAHKHPTSQTATQANRSSHLLHPRARRSPTSPAPTHHPRARPRRRTCARLPLHLGCLRALLLDAPEAGLLWAGGPGAEGLQVGALPAARLCACAAPLARARPSCRGSGTSGQPGACPCMAAFSGRR